MAKRMTLQAADLPEIPDYPNSPLSAWRHYGILKVLEERFQAELVNAGYTGHLVGLGLTYTVAGDSYAMEYGYGVKANQGILGNKEDPLSDDFVAEMYDLANELITKYMSPYVIDFDLQLSASVNPDVVTVDVKCQVATKVNCGKEECKGQCRKFISRNKGPWVCTHKKGSCKCKS